MTDDFDMGSWGGVPAEEALSWGDVDSGKVVAAVTHVTAAEGKIQLSLSRRGGYFINVFFRYRSENWAPDTVESCEFVLDTLIGQFQRLAAYKRQEPEKFRLSMERARAEYERHKARR